MSNYRKNFGGQKITINQLEKRGEATALEGSGADRHKIVKALYEHAREATDSERTKIIKTCYDRSEQR
jgi:hypothetical protein